MMAYLSGKPYHVVIMGAANVGKSSLVSRFLHNRLPEENCVPAMTKIQYRLDGAAYCADVQIIDTPGAEVYPSITKSLITLADAFILVFSVTDRASFKIMSELRKEILDRKGSGILVAIVASKTDVSPHQRQLHPKLSHSRKKSTEPWFQEYTDTSAYQSLNIEKAFQQVLGKGKIETETHRPMCLLGPLSQQQSEPRDKSCLM